jgi:hypothetical protein
VREVVEVGVRGAGLVSLIGAVVFLKTPLHPTIVRPAAVSRDAERRLLDRFDINHRARRARSRSSG